LYPTVNVWYRFWPRQIAISEIISFDKALRERISQRHIVDFNWAK
jgi:hypothetical protein